MKNKFTFLVFCMLLAVPIRSDWVNVTHEISNLNVNAITASGSYIFAGNDQYIYRSSNNGDNWQQVFSVPALALASSGSNIYMGYQYGAGRSSDYGNSWGAAGLNQWVLSLLTNGSSVYAGCFWPIPGGSTNRGVWISTNNGANWTQTTLNNVNVYSLTASGGYVFAGGGSATMGIYLTTNNGINWQLSLTVNSTVFALAASGSTIYAGVDGSPYGVYKSTNFGLNWTQTSLNYAGVQALAVYGSYVFAGSVQGLFMSSDSGTTWIPRNEGWGTPFIRTLCIYNNYIFSGTPGVWRRPIGELVDVGKISVEAPQKYELKQNYPNPFNPTTKIEFSVPRKSYVQLKIYDVLGRLKDELIGKELQPAEYELSFDGSNYVSGTYFYQLVADNLSISTRKFVLMK